VGDMLRISVRFAIRRDVFRNIDKFCGLVLWLGVGIAHKGSHTNPLAQITLIIYVAGLPLLHPDPDALGMAGEFRRIHALDRCDAIGKIALMRDP